MTGRLVRGLSVSEMTDVISGMSAEVIACNTDKGWHPDPVRTFGEECALLHSEISEMLEVFREIGFETRDVIVPHPQSHATTLLKPNDVASEFADLLIRLLHYCHVHEINLPAEFRRKMDFNWTRPYRHGNKRL